MNSNDCSNCAKGGESPREPAPPNDRTISSYRSKAARDLVILGVFSVALLAFVVHIGLFERLWELSRAHDGWELDELFSFLMLLPFCLILFVVRRWRELQSEMRHRIEIQKELASAKERAEAANRAKSSFLANMSHEIRTPLHAILGYSQLMLRDSALGVRAKESLDVINRSGEHLLGVINDILDMSKIEAGRNCLRPAPFDLSGLVEDLATTFHPRADNKGLNFETDFNAGSMRYVVADEGKIRQCLMNLLGNAIKFTERGGVQLRVSLTERPDNQWWLAAEVEDSGPGISAADQNNLFRPFSQVGSGLRAQSGTGLGLAITREFARLMGGDVTVHSVVAQGSVFRYEVPVQAGSAATVSTGGELRRVVGLAPGQEQPRLLVVDDLSDNRDWLNQLLTTVGFFVREAENGEVALQVWEAWQPDLILMDIRMPVMDGIEATRRIREHPEGNQAVIIALTASALDEEKHRIMQCGMNGFLSKPVQEDRLLEVIQDCLGTQYLRDGEAGPSPEARAAETPVIRRVPFDLPEQMIVELRRAIREGEKSRLDELIGKVREHSAERAGPLQELADSYEYDALTQLLEEVHR